MKPSPPPRRRVWTGGRSNWLSANPVLVIIAINVVVFIAVLIRGSLIGDLGLSPSLFTQKPWTIVTNMFVHSGFWHIFGNMLTLFFFGRVIYQIVGSGRFLLVYLGGGILGNLIYIWLGAPYSIAIGASGAVYALAGMLVVLMPKVRVSVWGIIPMPLWVVVLLFFVLWSIPGFIPQLAWQAHLGGLAAGVIAGFFFRKRIRYVSYR